MVPVSLDLSLRSSNVLFRLWTYFRVYFFSFVIKQLKTPHIKKGQQKKLCHFSAWRPEISKVVFTHGSVVCLPRSPVEVRRYVFLAVLYDHKLWPDHPGDPDGYCQIGHDTAVVVGSLTACIQSRNRPLFSRAGRWRVGATWQLLSIQGLRIPEDLESAS